MAAVGLGNSPSSPDSEVEEVVLMRSSGEIYGDTAAVTRSEAVSVCSGAGATPDAGRSGGDRVGERAEEPLFWEDETSYTFSTDPQTSVFRSVTGVANDEDDGAEATLVSDVEEAGVAGEMATNLSASAPPAADEAKSGEDEQLDASSNGVPSDGIASASSLALEIKAEARDAATSTPGDLMTTSAGDSSAHKTPRGGKRAATSMTPRRSKRIKLKEVPPTPLGVAASSAKKKKASSKAKSTTSDDSDVHFDVVANSDDPEDKGTHLQCKYCRRKLMERKGASARHLAACDAYKTRMAEEKALVIKLEAVTASSNATASNHSEAAVLEMLGNGLVGQASVPNSQREATVALGADVKVDANEASARLWLFGSVENADRMKTHYGRAPLAVAAPIERLHALIHDHLSDLEVPRLLETLGSDAKISTLMKGQQHVRRIVEIEVPSTEQAKELDALGLSLSFPPPPQAVDLVVSTLAKDIGLGQFAAWKGTNMLSCRAGLALEWQFHRSECFVLLLRGSAVWKLRAGGARHPLRCFHPRSRSLNDAVDAAKILGLADAPDGDGHARVAPPFDASRVFDDMDGAIDDVQEEAVAAGAVVYIPAGTWYEVETASDALWLEVHLRPMTYEQVMMRALRPLLWRSDKWRAPFLAGGAHDGGRDARQQMGELMEDLKTKITTLTPHDVVPEYLVMDSEKEPNVRQDMEFDLRKRVPFRSAGKHLKIQSGATFRVNPSAVLLCTEEVPHDALPTLSHKATAPGQTPSPSSRALQKKPKRTNVIRALASTDRIYVLHGGLGNDAFESMVRVKFRCSVAQAGLIEWIRDREAGRVFALEALKTGNMSGPLSDDSVKRVLRFLLCVGYVSPAKGES